MIPFSDPSFGAWCTCVGSQRLLPAPPKCTRCAEDDHLLPLRRQADRHASTFQMRDFGYMRKERHALDIFALVPSDLARCTRCKSGYQRASSGQQRISEHSPSAPPKRSTEHQRRAEMLSI
ncbi:hypothetical protein [Nitrosomonas communis]|uniref:hypothetical protein n=1 Tax=Nitrosomonas communis TaxID=44574 RepID=UPI0011151C73|nr:hypothetical protein [Nitrosomonas communis]